MRFFLSIILSYVFIYGQDNKFGLLDNVYRLNIEKNRSGFELLSAEKYVSNGVILSDIKVVYIYHDSLNSVEIYETSAGKRVALPLFMNYQDFTDKVTALSFQNDLHTFIETKMTTENATGLSGFSFGTNLKSKALTKLFGSSEVSLHINGSIEVDVSGSTENREGEFTSQADANRSSFSPKLDLRQQFTLEGRIGDKLTIEANQNSESQFDLENVLKIQYKGYEDEIIQSIEAGNIDLSLPATQFVSHGEKNKGLFGVKAKLQFGDLNFTGIASVEKGKKNKITITNGKAVNNDNAIDEDIKDFDYIKYKFFFVDTIFRSVFNDYAAPSLFPKKNPDEVGTRAGLIESIDIYSSTASGEQGTFFATAVRDFSEITSNGLDQDSIKISELGIYETYKFKKLTPGVDYQYDQERGYFYMVSDVRNEAIAISYKVDYKTQFDGLEAGNQFWMTSEETRISTSEEYLSFRANASTNRKFLKLIKSRNQLETANNSPKFSYLEKLHMKNVYYLGYDINELEIKIYTNNDINNIRPDGSGAEYVSHFGLDRFNSSDYTKYANPDGSGDKFFDAESNVLTVDNANDRNSYLIFPLLEPFNPTESQATSFYSIGGISWDSEFNSQGIYNYSTLPTNPKYKINITGKRVGSLNRANSTADQNTIDLGFGVLEGSERVIVNGEVMQSGIDYDINYFSGKLTLKSNRAILGKNNMEVEYESKNIFQLDKRTLIGGRFDYRFNEDAFLGATALYLKKSSLDEKVRIGQEPFENFIWDINGEYKTDSKFLTRLVNKIPGITTSEKSNISVQAEFAQIFPNPNTKNNEDAGDGDGVAYVDDFEAAKRASGLTLSRQLWRPASIPGIINGQTFLNQSDKDSNRAQIAYFNPFNRLDSKIIFNRETNSKDSERDISILNLAIRKKHRYFDQNNAEIIIPDNEKTKSIRPKTAKQNVWAGVMTSNKHNRDLNNVRFLEIWVQWDYPNRGAVTPKLNIDFGLISENFYTGDQVAGGFLASETTDSIRTVSGLITASSEDVAGGLADGILQPNEDVGMDRMTDQEEISVYGVTNPYDNWDGMRSDAQQFFFAGESSLKVNGEFKAELQYLVPWRINGTEGNSQESGYTRTPDTEDINLDNNININQNEYLHIEIDMPNDREAIKQHPYFSTFGVNEDFRWVQYRIPIKDLQDDPNAIFPAGAKPNLNAVDFIRVYVDNFDGLNDDDLILVNFAGIEFVSSDWQTMAVKDYNRYDFTNNEIGIESDIINVRFMDSEENSKISSSRNNYENYYIPPVGVQRNFKDAERTTLAKDRIMVLDINNLESGSKAEIYKASRFIANNLSFHNYKKMKMFMRTHRLDINEQSNYELPKSRAEFLQDNVHRNYFYIRFGSNDKNFYEYRVPIIANSLDSVIPDANNKDHQIHYWDNSSIEIDFDKLTRTKKDGIQLGNISGQEQFVAYEDPAQPLLERYKAVGKPDITSIQYIIFGVNNEDDKLNRSRPLSTQIWLNEMRVTEVRKEVGSAMRVNFSTKLADFMNISAKFESVEADFHKINETNTNAKGQADRENQSLSVLMNSDKFLPDTWRVRMPMSYSYNRNVSVPKYFPGTDIRTNYATEGFGEKIKHLFGFGTYNQEITDNSSFTNSQNLNISLKKDQTDKNWYNIYLLDNLNYTGSIRQTDGSNFQNSSDISESHGHKIDYNFTFSPSNFFQPFSFLGKGWYADWLSEVKLFYSPSSVRADLSVDYSRAERTVRGQSPKDPTITNSSKRGFTINYKLTESMGVDLTRTYQSKLDQVFIGDRKMDIYDLLENMFTNPFKKDAFGNDENISNNFSFNYAPSIINGVTTNFNYKSNFTYRENLSKQDAAMNQSKTLTYKFGLSPKSVIGSSASSSSRPSSGIGRGRGKKTDDSSDEDSEKSDETGEKASTGSGKVKFDFNWINPLYLLNEFTSIWDKVDVTFTKSINNGVDLVGQSLPTLKEQLFFTSGLDVDFKNPAERKFGGSESDNWKIKNDFKTGPVTIDFDNNYDFRKTLDPNQNNSFNNKYSYYAGDPSSTDLFREFKKAALDEQSVPLGIIIPDWSIRVSGVEKWPIFKFFSKRATLEHSRSGEVSTSYKNDPVNDNPVSSFNFTVKQEYKPFIRLDTDIDGGVNLKFTYNTSTSFNFNNEVSGVLAEDDSYSIDIGYSITGGFRFPFKFWPFNGSYVENDIKVNLNIFSQDRLSQNYNIVQGELRKNQGSENKIFRFEPSLTYQFSKTVNGAAYYRYSINETQSRGKTTKNAFGLKVNLLIRN
jgi:cell surface protein SprA